MLANAHQQGLDWVRQVSYALFALRQAHRDTDSSPYEVVFVYNVKTRLELLYKQLILWVSGTTNVLELCLLAFGMSLPGKEVLFPWSLQPEIPVYSGQDCGS